MAACHSGESAIAAKAPMDIAGSVLAYRFYGRCLWGLESEVPAARDGAVCQVTGLSSFGMPNDDSIVKYHET